MKLASLIRLVRLELPVIVHRDPPDQLTFEVLKGSVNAAPWISEGSILRVATAGSLGSNVSTRSHVPSLFTAVELLNAIFATPLTTMIDVPFGVSKVTPEKLAVPTVPAMS